MQPYASLRARVIVLLCGCLALMLGLLGLVINEANTRAIIEQNRVREAMFAHNVQISINQVLFAGKYQAQAYVESLMKDTEGLAYVAIIDGATRRVLVHADAQKVGQRWDDPVTEQALAALRTGKVIVQQHVTPDGYTIHDWALPYVHGYMHRPAGIIRIGIHCNVEQDLIRRSRLHTVGLFLAFLLAGAGLAVALSYRLSASLANLVAERTSQLDVANRHLRETKARLVAFIDNADAVIYMKDTEGRYLLVNRSFEAALGLPRDAILGKMDRELVPPEIAAGFHASDLKVLQHGGPYRYEEIVADPFGNRVYLSTKFAVHTEEGAIDVIGGVSTDITERKRLEELMREQFDQLKALDLLKGEFVNAVSHDLRTPLTSILGYAEFLEDGIGGLLAGQQLEFVSHIQKAAQRLERLVDDLLDFARIEAGTFTLRQEQAELGELVAEIVASLRPQAEEAHLHLTLDLPAEPLRLAVDFRRIQQVITNLLHNAIKFTPPGGTVAFRAIPSGAMLRCEVSDTGPGIAEEDIPRLFQRFAQLREGRAKGGTGLGLSISKAIVEAHGGEIGVISQPGAGATFWFTLPVASMDLPQPPPA